jgi:DNA-binding response OmpR family regulator
MKKVLIIDDEQDNLTLLSDMLKGSFEPLTAPSGKDGLALAVQTQPDVILLDINMPEMDGFEVCKRLREQPRTQKIPVIMLTTASSLDSRVKGLDIGADDYITKPFQVRELIARVNARVRRQALETKASSELAMGNLRLNPKSFEVFINHNPVKLTQLEFDLLRYFIEHPNEVIDRNRLLGDLWPDTVVTDRTVDTHVANLRKKIRGFDCQLTTVYGAGYILKTAGQP